jgi:hypothetical protein
MPSTEPTRIRLPDGTEEEVLMAFMGAEGRYEDYVYLKMLEREWKRTLTDADRFLDIGASIRPSPRAVIVVVFWAYFETRIERLLRQAMQTLPTSIMEDLLTRYGSIGARLDRLYQLLFSVSYWTDLKDAGFEAVGTLLRRLQQRRNEFAHGHPEAIDDALVEALIAGLKTEHEAWIAVFNKRAIRRVVP